MNSESSRLATQTRRHFLKTSLVGAAGAAWAGSTVKAEAAGEIIGHGEFRYRVDKNWSRLDPAQYPVNDCHEMVQVSDGRLFLLTNHRKNNVLIYDTEGRGQGAWTLDWGGAHGLSVHREADGREFLYLTDPGAGKVVKTTLEGEVVMELPHASKCGAYGPHIPYQPTETAVGPQGDIYVADGYGSQNILRFSKEGKYLGKFGGKSSVANNAGRFLQAHGVAIDNRGPEPLVLCTERIRNEFHWYTLEGVYVRSVYLPGAYLSRPVIHGQELYSAVCFGMFENDFRMWRERGFVTILDAQNRVVSNPGGKEPVYRDGKLEVMLQDQPVFRNCHDVCVDRSGDLYVCQWASGKVYPYKLHRV